MNTNGIHSGPQKIKIADAGYLYWVLKREKDSFSCANFRRHLTKVATAKSQLIGDHLIDIAAGQYLREGALTGTIRPHHRVHFAFANIQIETAKNGFSVDRCR